jgi:hypothetical protein
MTKLYYLKHQYDNSYIKIDENEISYYVETREEATVFNLSEIEKVVDENNLEVELITILVGKNV